VAVGVPPSLTGGFVSLDHRNRQEEAASRPGRSSCVLFAYGLGICFVLAPVELPGQMSTTVDGKGDPTCANSRISYLVVNEREDFGIAHAANGDLMHIWVVHGGTSKRDFWFIFAQPDPQTNA